MDRESRDIFEIIDIAMKDVYTRLEAINYKLSMSDDAKKFLAEKGYDVQFGARPLHRAIQKYLEDVLSDEMLKGRFKNGGLIEVSLQNDSLVFVEKADAVKVG